MAKTNLILILIAVVIIAGGLIFFMGGYGSNSNSYKNTPTNNPSSVNTGTPTDNNANTPKTVNVEISDFAYLLSTITIKKGDTVVWTNKDTVKHTVTSDSGSELDSELFGKSEIYSHTFNTAGTYNYHCTPHPYMKAKVIVE